MTIIAAMREIAVEDTKQYEGGINNDIFTDMYLMRFYIGKKADFQLAVKQMIETNRLRDKHCMPMGTCKDITAVAGALFYFILG